MKQLNPTFGVAGVKLKSKNSLFTKYLFVFLVASEFFFISLVTIARTGVTADAAIFIRMQAGWASGLVLYEEIFEMKDFGFFALNLPFFLVGGVPGLAVGGLIWTFVFTLSLYFVARLALGSKQSLVIALLLTCIWVMGPWFFPLYTETLSIALFTLGLAMLLRGNYFFAGFMFGLSVGSKLILIIPVTIVLVWFISMELFRNRLFLISQPWWRNPRITSLKLKASIEVALATIAGGATMLLWAFVSGSLPGWFEVVKTNRDYQGFTGIGFFDIGGLRVLVASLSSNFLFLLCVVSIVVSVTILLSSIEGRKALKSNFQIISTLMAGFLATAWAAKLQNASGHHSQLPLAVLLMIVVFLLALTFATFSASRLWIKDGLLVGSSLVFLFLLGLTHLTPVSLVTSASESWNNLTNGSALDNYLLEFPRGLTLSLSFTTGPKFYFEASTKLNLICRHHGNGPIGSYVHREDVEACIENPGEVVVWEDKRVYGDWLGYAELWSNQKNTLIQTHRVCESFDSSVLVYVLKDLPCPA